MLKAPLFHNMVEECGCLIQSKMSCDNFTPVPKFDTGVSSTYDEWRLQFMFLRWSSRICKKIIKLDERSNDIKEDEWEDKSNTSMYNLSLAVKLDKLVDCETPKQVLDKFW